MPNEQAPPTTEELLVQLRLANELMAKLVRNQRDWKLSLRQGVMTGLGSVLGATLVVSFLLWTLQPLRQLQILKEPLDRIAKQLEERPARVR